LEKAKEIISAMQRAGVSYVTFSGGEPFLYTGLTELIRYAREKGIRVSVTTNGTLITPALAQELMFSGIDGIGVSLDYPGDVHDTVRAVPQAFKKADEAISLLLQYRKGASPVIDISTVVSRYNYAKLRDVFRYAREKGIDGVALQPFVKATVRDGKYVDDFSLSGHEIAA
jgi:MoaA/NifB/PqqE/SkfB family radical SAM enzyme